VDILTSWRTLKPSWPGWLVSAECPISGISDFAITWAPTPKPSWAVSLIASENGTSSGIVDIFTTRPTLNPSRPSQSKLENLVTVLDVNRTIVGEGEGRLWAEHASKASKL
jgi:hypothetical protein